MQRMDAENESKDVSINLSLNDYICPITNQIFFNPVQVLPCGHFFEDRAIEDWKTRDATCPCCREKMEAQYPTPPYFNRQLMELLEKNPQLYDECYFNVDDFKKCLREDDEKKSVSPQLKKWTNVLKNSKMHSNNIFPFLISSEVGLRFLSNHALIREKITEELLNHPSEFTEISPLRALSQTEAGIRLLSDDVVLRGKITSEGLNDFPKDGVYAGISVLTLLVQHPLGLELLSHDPALRQKISAESVNGMQNESHVSVLFLLSKSEVGRKILLDDARLRNLIHKDTLNKIIFSNDENCGKSAASFLSTYGKGLLILDPVLLMKIEREEKKVSKSFFKSVKDKFRKLEICFQSRKP